MEDNDLERSVVWVGKRLAIMFVIVLVVSFGFYVLHAILGVRYEGISIGIGILFVLPACLSALVTLAIDPDDDKPIASFRTVPVQTIGVILVLGGIFLQEGIICIVILAPLWLIGAAVGSILVYNLQAQYREKFKPTVMKCSVLVFLPFLALFFDANFEQSTQEYRVTRSVIIETSAENIWPHLLEMNDLQVSEGRWNVAQNMLGIPRPRSAKITGRGVGAVRMAHWGEHISFEEHITEWSQYKKLMWTFYFPNDSLQHHTDRHISPDGAHLKILDGGYRLRSLGAHRTELILHTRYIAKTPVNTYSALWGQLFLGGIQNNVLHIVKDRAELSPP
ncbi:MAG: hypothetical protein COA43_05735 [Robiginitomaculum sp.]|nr:MAG: hypothetical protein COA43_05735 [Robiginitomaculum sp.]